MANDEVAVQDLSRVPRDWSLEHDEALVQLMSQHIPRDNDALGSIKSYVEHVDVSSYCVSSHQSSILHTIYQLGPEFRCT